MTRGPMDRTIPDVFDDLEIGITLHDPETGEILGVNERLEALYGYTAAELREMDVADYTAAADCTQTDAEFTQADAERRIHAAADGEPQIFEWPIERSTGERVWVRVRLAATQLHGEAYVIAEIREITERKEREAELRTKQQAVEQAPVGITLTDPTQDDNPLVYANEEFFEITGYSRATVDGWNHRQLQGPDTEEAAVAELRSALDDERATTVDLRNYRTDGTLFWNRVSLAPIYDESGELANWVGFQEDITDQKRREQQLAELHEATRRLLAADTTHEVAEVASETVSEVLGFSMNSINLYDDSREGLVPAAVSDGIESVLDEPPVLDSGLAWAAFEDGEAVVYDDLDTVEELYNPDTEFRSEMYVPVGSHGLVIVAATEPEAFSETDLTLAKILAANVETTLDRAEHQQQLAAERAFIEESLDTIDDVFYMLDPDGSLTRWNATVTEVTGYTDREVSEMHALDFFAESDRPTVADAMEEIIETGSAVMEAEYVTKDGEGIPYEFTGTRLTDDEGDVRGIIGIGRDIADRKARLERHQRQEAAFRKLHQTAAQSAPLEEKIAELLDFGREFMDVEQGFFTEIDGDIQEIAVGVGPNEQLKTGETAPFDHSYCRYTVEPDREEPLTVTDAATEGWEGDPAYERFGLGCYVGATVTADGETVGTICFADRTPADKTFTEIQETFVELLTEWISYELERAARERKYRRLTERISDAYYAVDTDFEVTYWNDAMTDRLSIPTDEVIGENLWEYFPEVRGTVVEDRLREAMESQEPTECEYYYEPANYWTELQIYPDEDGLAVISKDITDRKRYQAELERSNERLQEFAYILSHDLQEPLRMVSSYIDLLEMELDGRLDEETREYMEFAVDGAERMRGMIDGLLQYSRVETEGEAFSETDVAAVIEEVREDLQFTLDEADTELVVGSLPAVLADADQLRQLFQNLVSNAVDHGGAGTTVEISAEETPSGYEIAVRDDGPGIPADQQADLFGLFDTGVDSDGTGIGLAICERIVSRHDGDIRVESAEGEGTTFYVTLPAA